MRFKVILLLTLCLFLFKVTAEAQIVSGHDSLGPFCLKNIDKWSIHSSVIGEDYTLYVLRTEAYDTSDVRLPVLYMTDGDWNMTVAMNCFSMLRQDYDTREPLVVGIGYGNGINKRTRDLDPDTGGPAFLEFIEKEVIPFVNEKYRTGNEKAIYGYSMGGMFTTYILFHRPDLFDMVFIGAPANNGRTLMPSAQEYFRNNRDLKSKVFIGVGSYEKEVVRNINEFTDYLLSLKCTGLTIRKGFTPGAGHGAALAQVMQNAIAFGYCEQHEAVKIDPVILNRYEGRYVSENKSVPELLVYKDNDKFFWKVDKSGEIPDELLPLSNTEFFMEENQRILFKFNEENNKTVLVVTLQNKSEYSFVRQD
jgi:predicted alpha/beta superfamily hydrolase